MLTERWKIQLLGSLVARQGEQTIERFRTRKGGEMLAALALHPRYALPREELLLQLWPEDEPGAARNRLRVELTALRRQFQAPDPAQTPLIEADRLTIRLLPEAFTTDTAEFEQDLAQVGRTSERIEQIRWLVQAVDLYRGDLLPDYDADWIITERERFAALHQEALRRLIRRLAHERDFDRAIAYAQRALQADAWNEEMHFDLIRLFVAVGQPSAAIRQYEALEQTLREQFAAQPTAVTREFIQQIRDRRRTAPIGVADEVPEPTLPSPPASATPTELPVRLTRFFGREREQREVAALLQANRLVTLTGPGGNGKTRLITETAASLLPQFPGGIRFVYLGNLLDIGQLPDALRQTLHLPARAGIAPIDQVIEALSKAPSLLILDNFEHLAEQGASLVQALLEAIPPLTIAVTSRRVLGIGGEREFPVTPLPTPSDAVATETLIDFASVRLFLDRAQAVRPDFQLVPRNADAIASVCRYLEGIPLAIELAAARIRTLTPTQMTDRLVPRLELLVNPRADKDARHRSLRTTIAWSVRMLSPDARRFFARLAVFQGGWDVEAAADVCLSSSPEDDPEGVETSRWSAFDLLERLLSESLLIAEEQNGTMRFRMLETLREFAWEQLPPHEQERMRHRHASYWMEFGETIETRMNGPELGNLLNRLEAERANLTVALLWCQEEPATGLLPSPVEIGLRMMGALWRFWDIRGNIREGRQFTERLLAQASPDVALKVLARAHTAASTLAKSASDFTQALEHCEQALEQWRLAGSLVGVAVSLGNKGNLLGDVGRLEEARECQEAGLAIVKELDIPWRIATFQNNLGSLLRILGDYDAALANLEEALERRKQIGDRRSIFSTLNNLAALAHHRGDYPAATRGHEEALSIVRELNDQRAIANSLVNLGLNYLALKDYSASYRYLTESLQLNTDAGNPLGQAFALGGLASHAAASHSPERAGMLLGAAHQLAETLQVLHMPLEEQMKEPVFVLWAADSRFLDALEAGRNIPLEAAISLALQPL